MSNADSYITESNSTVTNRYTNRAANVPPLLVQLANDARIDLDSFFQHFSKLSMPERYLNNFRPNEILLQKRMLDELAQGDGRLALLVCSSRSNPTSTKLWLLGKDCRGLGSSVWNAIDHVAGMGIHAIGSAVRGIQCVCRPMDYFVWSQHFPQDAVDRVGDRQAFARRFLSHLVDAIRARHGWNFEATQESWPDHLLAYLHDPGNTYYAEARDRLRATVVRHLASPKPTTKPFKVDEVIRTALPDLIDSENGLEAFLRKVDSTEYYLPPTFRPNEILQHKGLVSEVVDRPSGLIWLVVQPSASDRTAVKVWLIGTNKSGVGSCIFGAFDDLGVNAGDGIQFGSQSQDSGFFIWSQHFNVDDIKHICAKTSAAVIGQGDGVTSILLNAFQIRLRDALELRVRQLDLAFEVKWSSGEQDVNSSVSGPGDGASLLAILHKKENKSFPSLVKDRRLLWRLANNPINEGPQDTSDKRRKRMPNTPSSKQDLPHRKADVVAFDPSFFKVLASRPCAAILLLLLERREPLTISEIADAVRIKLPNVSTSVDRLANAGFIDKRRDSTSQGGVTFVEVNREYIVGKVQSLLKLVAIRT